MLMSLSNNDVTLHALKLFYSPVKNLNCAVEGLKLSYEKQSDLTSNQ